jgi:hypothetical protein
MDFFRDDQATTPVVTIADGTSLPRAVRGDAYRICLESPAAKALYWEITGSNLPPGLTLARNGLLRGTPTRSGAYRFDVIGRSPYGGRPFHEADVTVTNVKLVIE